MNYWEECIREALEDAGLAATEEQVATLVGWVEGAHENYGMAHGYDAIPYPVESQAKRELEELRRHVEEHKEWMRETIYCVACRGTGDRGYSVCTRCNGSGRVRR